DKVEIAHATRAPGLRLPGRDRAVFLRADLDASEDRRPRACDHQLGVAFKHDLDRFSASHLGKPRRFDTPAINWEFTAESASDVTHFHVDVAGGNAQHLRELAPVGGN